MLRLRYCGFLVPNALAFLVSDGVHGKFQVVCRTCGSETYFEMYEAADDRFVHHGEDDHDVMLVNTEEREPISLE